MIPNEEAFFKELLSMFKIEAEEHLKAISSGLINLEKTKKPEDRTNIVETIYREAHSLKGASRAVNLIDVETVCQTVETIFSALKHQKLEIKPELFDVLHQSIETIEEVIENPGKTDISSILRKMQPWEELAKKGDQQVVSAPPIPQVEEEPVADEDGSSQAQEEEATSGKSVSEPDTETDGQTESAEQEKTVTRTIPKEVEKALVSDTIRISTSKLDSLLLQTEEMLSGKLSSQQQAIDLKEVMGSIAVWRKEWEKRELDLREEFQSFEKNGEQNPVLKNKTSQYLDFVSGNVTRVKDYEEKLMGLTNRADGNSRNFGMMLDSLLEDMKKILMLPFSTLLRILPKVVRDLSRDQGKDVELIVKGSTIEIDRRILEELKDPFIHLLRNCIDHGIEKPNVRAKNKKPRGGTISIAISQMSGNQVEIMIVDDGGGIDADKIRQVAVKKGILTQAKADALSDEEAVMMIFQSEVSTSPIITDISGRGLGMPIVREKVEKLGGTLTMTTKVGEGTRFSIVLPVTLAKFRGILVNVQDQMFVIPTGNVERVIRFMKEDIKLIENRDCLVVDGQVVALVRLQDVLEMPEKKLAQQESEFLQALVLTAGDQRTAFSVDMVLNEQEVLVKNLGKQLLRVRNIAGATILGSGRVVAILNITDLLKSATQVASVSTGLANREGEKLSKKRLLIAEDSITSRTLLKNILESAGYEVKTTVDGMDALSALKTETFDLVVSDIEMPRMNGFDLVSKIRADRATAELPVVLVTALESREDRERGIDVGANAYIVKRSFDQSNLLEVIKKLI